MTTEISFYHLSSVPIGKALPQLLEKILEKLGDILVVCKDEKESEELNELIWSTTNKFIPHGNKNDDFKEMQPVFLTSLDEMENPKSAKIIASTTEIPAEKLADFSHHIFMFENDNPEMLQSARNYWKKLKDADFALKYWKQDEKGKWELKS